MEATGDTHTDISGAGDYVRPMSGTRYDEIDRFLMFVEQLRVAYDLLDAGLGDDGLAKARLALIGIDNLANLLLHTHAEKVFVIAERGWSQRTKRYTKKERRKILGDFDRLVNLATKEFEGRPRCSAIVDASDAEVMRCAHTYRNAIYHEDRHNGALLPLLTALYAHAVGRAFCRFHGHGWSYGIDSERAKRLAVLGYEPDPDRFTKSSLMLDFGPAARRITEDLAGRLTIDDEALRTWLATDIVERTRRVAGVLLALLDDGLPPERLEWIFFWSQFWAEHGADEEWLALEDERDELADNLSPVGPDGRDETDPAVVAYRAAEQAYIGRAHILQRAFKPPVNCADPPRLGALGSKLADARNVSSLLSRYSRIDHDVERLERATDEAAAAWERMVEVAVDRTREGG
jgi:hypothetical protein